LDGQTLHHASVSQRRLAQRVLLEQRDGLQELMVFENPVFSRTLVLDSVVQTTERDEFIYHEMIAHVPLFAHGAPRHVLIVGGGDGGTLRQVLRHRTVESATLVDIDERVIHASRAHLSTIHAGASTTNGRGWSSMTASPSCEVIAGATTSSSSIRPIRAAPPGASSRPPLHALPRAPGQGWDSGRAGWGPFLQPNELTLVTDRLSNIFRDVAAYTAAVSTYYWACDDSAGRAVSLPTLERRFAEAAIPTRYYASDVHLAAFAAALSRRPSRAPMASVISSSIEGERCRHTAKVLDGSAAVIPGHAKRPDASPLSASEGLRASS
jgi:spermidine synthase